FLDDFNLNWTNQQFGSIVVLGRVLMQKLQGILSFDVVNLNRSFIKRSLSGGNILHECYTLLSSCSFSQNAPSSSKSSQVGY
ncbi:hypothetical protein BHE74_00030855, partial [Ensete ventricosum]